MPSAYRRASWHAAHEHIGASTPQASRWSRALRDAANPAGLDPWKFGSSTIGTLKRSGFIVVRNGAAKPRRYELTDSGRSVLAEFGAARIAVMTRTVCHSGVTLAPGDQVEVSVHAYADYHTVYRVRRIQGHTWEEIKPGVAISCSFYSVEVD
jgi:hypothetical protein